jgi:hypothetical protein
MSICGQIAGLNNVLCAVLKPSCDQLIVLTVGFYPLLNRPLHTLSVRNLGNVLPHIPFSAQLHALLHVEHADLAALNTLSKPFQPNLTRKCPCVVPHTVS